MATCAESPRIPGLASEVLERRPRGREPEGERADLVVRRRQLQRAADSAALAGDEAQVLPDREGVLVGTGHLEARPLRLRGIAVIVGRRRAAAIEDAAGAIVRIEERLDLATQLVIGAAARREPPAAPRPRRSAPRPPLPRPRGAARARRGRLHPGVYPTLPAAGYPEPAAARPEARGDNPALGETRRRPDGCARVAAQGCAAAVQRDHGSSPGSTPLSPATNASLSGRSPAGA